MDNDESRSRKTRRTHAGHEATDGASSIVLSRVQLNFAASRRLGLGAGLLKLGRGLGAELLRLALDVVNGGECAVELGAGLVARRFRHGRGVHCLVRTAAKRGRKASLEGILSRVEE